MMGDTKSNAEPGLKRFPTGLILILIWVCIILLIVFVILAIPKTKTGCPREVKGSENPVVSIAYMDSPTCVYCWLEVPVLKKMVEIHGDEVKLEYYDINDCRQLGKEYAIAATPSFIFFSQERNISLVRQGYLSYPNMERIICSLGVSCSEKEGSGI